MTSAQTALSIDRISKRFGSVQALRDLSLDIPLGGITAVLGPNGAGKTTLMEICEGLARTDSGSVTVLGLDPITDVSQLRLRRGVMVQDGGLPGSSRAGELIPHVASMYQGGHDPHALMNDLGITTFASTPIRRLSGGQRQRVALALALVGDPELVFLDEPSTGLDPASRRLVWELVDDLRSRGVTIILTTHLMEEAQELADRVVIVDAGEVIAEGSVAELLAVPSVDAPASMTVSLKGHLTPADLAELTRWANARGVAVEPRTLEDVFLDLTGRRLA